MLKVVISSAVALVSGTAFVLGQETLTTEGLQVYFGFGSATISAEQMTVLDEAARLFREGSPLVMIVAGSADTVGSAESNLNLSIRRARAVATSLADRGIPIERLQVLGRGNSELNVATEDGVANAQNRVVSITWR